MTLAKFCQNVRLLFISMKRHQKLGVPMQNIEISDIVTVTTA